MTDIDSTILNRYILYLNNNNILNASIRFCDMNCKEDLVFNDNIIYKTISIFGDNNEYQMEKNIHNITELMEQIFYVYNNNEFQEEEYPFQGMIIRRLNDESELNTDIAIVHYIEFYNNILYIEVSNPT